MNSVSGNKFVFFKIIPGIGTIQLRHLDVEQDIPLIHQWLIREYAKFWGMQNKSVREVKEEYYRITSLEHSDVFIGYVDNRSAFLLERYHPLTDPIGRYYDAQVSDCGIHLIVAPPDVPLSKFTFYVMSTILLFIFEDAGVHRVIVEPDIRNEKMFKLCQRVGFECGETVTLPHKTARMAYCNRKQFFRMQQIPAVKNTNMNTTNVIPSPDQSIRHLQREPWSKANRLLIKKAICEFSHEGLINPRGNQERAGWNRYILQSDEPSFQYRFRAKQLALNHLLIDTDSIQKFNGTKELPLDAILFIKEFKTSLGIAENQLPLYLEEITSTLYASAYNRVKENHSSQELIHADFQTIEQSMTEGHPCFVANNGRIGFDTSDYSAYAPESGNPFPLLWLAGHKDRTVYAGTKVLPYQVLLEQELSETDILTFNKVIKDKGVDPGDYFFIPVHPWQWFNKIATVFAPELAAGKLICLGYGGDRYQAQQSIRTLFNLSHPHKFYTKTALSILNMGFMRGLPVYYLGTAPAMAQWLEDLLYKDPYIRETGFAMLAEVASISYIHPYYEEFGKHHAYNKMLASLWRESPVKFVKPGQQLMTMAALLHIDQEGSALLPELIRASGLSIDRWLDHYLKTYLSPLLHCFYAYDLVFMPHGENLILVLENHVPVKAFIKDITEEAVILNPEVKLPEQVARMYAKVPDEVKLLSLFIDVFDGFFRFIPPILLAHAGYAEENFWKRVAECVSAYQEQHPHLKEKFSYYDLFASEFQLSCLNRLQLANNQTMINLDDPVALLQFRGKLKNPIAAFKKQKRTAIPC